ncbi:hypothetical protein WT60_18535 [Burkholderia sp. MSMB617WGS]|uniref:Uncharacterized protein n=1 Tax=Burkholderia savannae TaxID=1637837 RepID=A0ABR5T213_9BURK|nr:hypothetical protein WT60_18535 [Burkholderia sp. MSMB617WGS]KWZ37271.1 hypothetical protein WS72_19910 [Burkholderia savannae]
MPAAARVSSPSPSLSLAQPMGGAPSAQDVSANRFTPALGGRASIVGICSGRLLVRRESRKALISENARAFRGMRSCPRFAVADAVRVM